LEKLREHAAQLDANGKRLNAILQRSDDRQQMIRENDHLKRAIQQNNSEHKAQVCDEEEGKMKLGQQKDEKKGRRSE
jgi:hypothetical protein